MTLATAAYNLDEQVSTTFSFEYENSTYGTAYVEEETPSLPSRVQALSKVRKEPVIVLRTSIRSSAAGIPGYRIF